MHNIYDAGRLPKLELDFLHDAVQWFKPIAVIYLPQVYNNKADQTI